MAIYYVCRKEQVKGEHVVHKNRCKHMPDEHNRIMLGDFYTCFDAIRVAKGIYANLNGCSYCCPECHIS